MLIHKLVKDSSYELNLIMIFPTNIYFFYFFPFLLNVLMMFLLKKLNVNSLNNQILKVKDPNRNLGVLKMFYGFILRSKSLFLFSLFLFKVNKFYHLIKKEHIKGKHKKTLLNSLYSSDCFRIFISYHYLLSNWLSVTSFHPNIGNLLTKHLHFLIV